MTVWTGFLLLSESARYFGHGYMTFMVWAVDFCPYSSFAKDLRYSDLFHACLAKGMVDDAHDNEKDIKPILTKTRRSAVPRSSNPVF